MAHTPVGMDAYLAASAAMRRAVRFAKLYAPARTTVVLVGATGTGKTSLARLTHSLSGRSGPFVEVTAGELSENLGQDQLFGHERGAFTHALGRRLGMFASAAAGTLLLDDFHLLPTSVQAMLLRALDRGLYRPHGSDRDIQVQCRLVVGLRECPDALMKAGDLLPDLRYRLGFCVIRLPCLEERREEIGPLATLFLSKCPDETGVPGPARFAPDVLPVLEAGAWPGNVREFQGVVRAAFLNAQGAEAVSFDHLPDHVRLPARFEPYGDPEHNRRVIEWGLWRTGGRVEAAAKLIGAHRNTISSVLAEQRRAEARPDEAHDRDSSRAQQASREPDHGRSRAAEG